MQKFCDKKLARKSDRVGTLGQTDFFKHPTNKQPKETSQSDITKTIIRSYLQGQSLV